ncbi:MAG: hypothetical protein IPM35_20050 [Myxococcales bacterium]|nr:hypothetical protein [Myxococcales bacterium]
MPTPNGEAGGLFVQTDGLPGRRCYLKPTKSDAGFWRAGREKIAADLAHDLGVNVPPGILGERLGAGSDEKRVFVSLVLYPLQWSWGELKRLIGAPTANEAIRQHVVPKLQPAASLAFVFDAWVGQYDHDDHDHNVLFGYDPTDYSNGSFVFLDFAFSLGAGGTWAGKGVEDFTPGRFPPLMVKSLDKAAVGTMIKKIEDLDPELVRDVVHRIPEPYLPKAAAEEISAGLLVRKSRLREAVDAYLTGGKP